MLKYCDQIPNDWTWSKIRDVANVNPSSSKPAYNELVTFLGMADVSEEGSIIGGTEKTYSQIRNDFTSFQNRDVIVAKITPCFENKKGALVNGLTNGIGFGSTEFHVIRTSLEIIPEYLHIISRSYNFRVSGERNMTGTAGQKRVPVDFIKDFIIPVPPINEQKHIAHLLEGWDEAIAKTAALIAEKEKRIKWLKQQMLFGALRTENFAKDADYTQHKWFSIPSDWQYIKIGSIAEEVAIKNSHLQNCPVLSCTVHYGLVNSLEFFGKRVFSKDVSNYKVVPEGHFAYATNHIEEGSIGYQSLYEQGLVSPMYTVFKCDPVQVDDGYLYKLLKTEIYRHLFEVNTRASVNRRGGLRWNEFSKIYIPLPPLSEQRYISHIINELDEEIRLLNRKLEALKRQKRGLMQKLLTGQWRVKENARKEAAE